MRETNGITWRAIVVSSLVLITRASMELELLLMRSAPLLFACGFEFEPQPAQFAADHGAHRCGMLADPSGEYEAIEALQCQSHGADRLRDFECKQVDSFSCARITV